MATLWEDTVITAMRDEKWQHALRHGAAVPLPQLKLSGCAEQRLGDLFDVASDDRFFLFEVKAWRQGITSEWTTANATNEYQKRALRTHIRWLNDLCNTATAAAAQEHLRQSRRGHFFAYWAEYGNGPAPAFDSKRPLGVYLRALHRFHDGVVIEPYLSACRDMGMEVLADLYTERAQLALRLIRPDSYVARTQVPLPLVYEGRAVVAVMDSQDSIDDWDALGLSLEEMRTYLKALCAVPTAGQSEPIHAVVMSTSGQFFRVLFRTTQLEALLRPSPRRARSLLTKTQRHLTLPHPLAEPAPEALPPPLGGGRGFLGRRSR